MIEVKQQLYKGGPNTDTEAHDIRELKVTKWEMRWCLEQARPNDEVRLTWDFPH